MPGTQPIHGTLWTLSFLAIGLAGAVVVSAEGPNVGPPPATRSDDVVDTLHGVKVPDPYRWLEDQSSAETRAWINAQNGYSEPILSAVPGREQLEHRLTELMKTDVVGVPIERNGRFFFARRRADQDQFVIYMRQGLQGADTVLLDPHPLSADHTTSEGLMDVSQDGTALAYDVRQGGQDETEIRFLDVGSRKDLPDHLPKARYLGGALRLDKSGFYYTLRTAEGPRAFYHAMGTDPAADTEIFGKGYAPENGLSVQLSEDGHYLLLAVWHGSAGDKTELYAQDLAAQGPIFPVVNDITARFGGDIEGDRLFLQTNWKAPNERILIVDLHHPERELWREVIPESDAVIEGFTLSGGKLFVHYTQNAISLVKAFDPDGHPAGEINFPTLGSVSGVVGRWTSKQAFFAFSSYFVPPTVYSYDVASGRQEVWARRMVPVEPDRFELQQVWYESKDKTRVPMFLVYKKGLHLDGSNPALLTGYGGFNSSSTPNFSATAVAWAESGGVFAVANLRGGGEFGEKWHRAGMLGNKQNVFDDFIAAAEWLIAQKYTSASKFAIMGGSNGGLLVGAALTQRPDLFRAVLCLFPLLDMLRYQKFLVAQWWVPEYGSSDDAVQFKYLETYSPYQHVVKGTKYPAVLFVTGDGDTRVAPLHARKMTALVQSATGSDPSQRPVLLKYDTKAGHSQGMPINRQVEDTTDELGFLFWQVAMTPQ
ncbi:MAG: prolyl oligopeptidase family serine peptidase [Terriglobia bacterium]